MIFEFEYLLDNQVVNCVVDAPVYLRDTQDSAAFKFLNSLKDKLKLSKKQYLAFLKLFIDIRFTNHTTSSWLSYGTANAFDQQFFMAITTEELKPRVRYTWRLSDKGVEFYNFLDSILLVDDDCEADAKQFLLDYLDFKQL